MDRVRTRKAMRRIAPVAIALAGLMLAGCSDNRDESSLTGPRGPTPSFQVVPGSGAWTSRAPMPTARYEPGVGEVNGVLYAVAGLNGSPWNGTGILPTLEAYDPSTNMWTTKASLPNARGGEAAAVVNGVLYVVGGYDTGTPAWLATLEAYDPVTNTWTQKASMPTARQEPGAGVINGVLYVVGGSNGTPPLSTVEAYDPETNTWTTKAPMLTGRGDVSVGVVNGVLYAVGGSITNAGLAVATADAYDPVSNTWTTKAPMSIARQGAGVGVVNGILYVAGGWSDGFASVLSTVEAYDPVTDTWTTLAPMPTPRVGLRVGVVNGVIYTVGGWAFDVGSSGIVGSGTVLSTNEAFTPAPAEKSDQTITFSPLSNRTLGDPSFALNASASSGLPVTFSASGSCTVSGTTVTITTVGSCIITADQPGDDAFNPAPSVQRSFSVSYNAGAGHGFLQPINTPPQQQSVFKIGSTIPVKFQLFLANGVTPVSTAVATIQVNKVSSGVPSAVNETVTSTVPNQGINFRYDAGSQQYIFNLGTKGWTSGTYQITALLNDGSNITVNVGAR